MRGGCQSFFHPVTRRKNEEASCLSAPRLPLGVSDGRRVVLPVAGGATVFLQDLTLFSRQDHYIVDFIDV
jgi:hypothetical protein